MGRATSVRAILQSAQAGNANGSVLELAGLPKLAVQVDATGFTGTVNFEASLDATNWHAVPMQKSDGTWVSTATAGGMFCSAIAIYTHFRARTSGVSGGSVTVTGFAQD